MISNMDCGRWPIFSRWRTMIALASTALPGLRDPGFTAMGVFLFFGAVMATLAATTLLWRGTEARSALATSTIQ